MNINKICKKYEYKNTQHKGSSRNIFTLKMLIVLSSITIYMYICLKY